MQSAKPVFSIAPVSWAEQGPALSAIRRQVFMEEQRVPAREEWDGQDQVAQHFLAHSITGAPIGVARVLANMPATGQEMPAYHIGRVAVLPHYRCQGIGTRLMETVIDWCHRHAQPKPARIMLNAQLERLAFYRHLGFVPQGEVFIDAGIAHRAMLLQKGSPSGGEP